MPASAAAATLTFVDNPGSEGVTAAGANESTVAAERTNGARDEPDEPEHEWTACEC